MPKLPKVELEPDVVFLLFLPPLLYVSAIFTSWRDFEDTAERMRGLYNYRRSRFAARSDGGETEIEDRSAAYQRLLRELLRAQRKTLVRLRDEGEIGDEAMHRIERDLDLEESRLEV